MATDQFDMEYFSFNDGQDNFVIIGPYISRPHEALCPEICQRLQVPLAQIDDLKGFYYRIPFIENVDRLESELAVLLKYVLKTDEFNIECINIVWGEKETEAIKEEQDSPLSMRAIEERYETEDALLEAVSQGDLKQAITYMGIFSKYHFEQRHSDSLRNAKNYGFVLNTLLRKAVQRSAVHPAHIHKVSTAFALRIETVLSRDELSKTINEMLRKYCLLVRNHSLRRYSLPVRRAVDYIDFNFTEQLSLEQIAQAAAVNYSYLSSQFKKETGSSVVDRINMKRMEKALTLLTTTRLPIGGIAERCAFENDSYFTRTFRKLYGKSPREYRRDIQDVK